MVAVGRQLRYTARALATAQGDLTFGSESLRLATLGCCLLQCTRRSFTKRFGRCGQPESWIGTAALLVGVGSSNGRSRLQPSGTGQSKLLCTLIVCTPWYGTEVSTERGGYRHIWSVAIWAQALLFEIKRFYIYMYTHIYIFACVVLCI